MSAALRPAILYLLTLCRREVNGGHTSDAEIIAVSNGPSVAECASRTLSGQSYGPSVLRRATTSPPGAWLERIRLYREGLAFGNWTPNDNTKPIMMPRREASEETRKRGTFNYPITIIFGLDDLAFDTRIVLDRIEDFFAYNGGTDEAVMSLQSHVIRLPGQGHWFFTSARGAEIVERALVSLLTGLDGHTAVQAARPCTLQDAFAREMKLGELSVAVHT